MKEEHAGPLAKESSSFIKHVSFFFLCIGSMHQSTIESLTSDTKYYFKVRAGTQAGDGPPTDAVAAQTLPVNINKRK